MNKYFIFRQVLALVDKHAEVVDADMDYCGRVRIVCEDTENTIVIEVAIKDKEENKND